MALTATLTTFPPSAPEARRPGESDGRGPGGPGRRPRPATPPWLGLDADSRSWWVRLHATEPVRGWAIAELHERLRREAAFQIRLRVRALPDFPRSDIDDLAMQAADDALMTLLRKLEDYRGDSQFWTWARRFAALEAPVSVRRRLGRDRVGISRDPDLVLGAPDCGCSVHEHAELHELVQTVSDLIAGALTPRQRTVVIAIALDGVATQTLAGELHTTPGAIYKTLHDARRKLRAQLPPS
jgi:RNA polymerase sigma-70 factor, ECF subfamily